MTRPVSANGDTHDHNRGDDAAAYVLGALTPSEAADYRQHLAVCTRCREEFEALAPVANALASAVPQIPVPPDLKRRVLRAAQEQPHEVRSLGRRVQSPRVAWALPGLTAGIVAACVGVILAFVALRPGHEPSRVVAARVIGSPGTAQVRISHNHGELVIARLPPPPAGRIYEVWLRRGFAGPAPTSALFSVTSSGAATVDVPGDLRGIRQIIVTQEPAGGSRVPTRRPLIVASLT